MDRKGTRTAAEHTQQVILMMTMESNSLIPVFLETKVKM